MAETNTQSGAADANDPYGPEYYHSHCGLLPYTADSQHWLQFYGHAADEIVRSLTPKRVFDAGCALGFLVAALWDRNIEAYGRDISEFAISEVRSDVRSYCSVGSIADPIEGEYDLVLCIEVLEHMPEDEALEAIRMITRAAPRVLFSSTPSDFDEPTHVNVRPIRYWLRHFADAGFAPVVTYDTTYLCPHGILFERSEEGRTDRDLTAFGEVVRQRIATAAEAAKTFEVTAKLNEINAVLTMEMDSRQAVEAAWKQRTDALEARVHQLQRIVVAPLGVYRLGLRASRVAWWTVSMQLPDKLHERRERRAAQEAARLDAAVDVEVPAVAAREAIAHRFASNDPISTFVTPGTDRRLNIVTDSVGEGSLYGGVGTAFVLARLLAERTNARLRLITRTEPADIHRVKVVLEAQGLPWPGEIEAVHAPPFGPISVPVQSGDFFLTTSWWTTRATLPSVPNNRVISLLQEDERMFYPWGDDRVRCSETLADPDLHVVVNSELLFRHLTEGPEPLAGLAARAHWFEPAFPARLFHDAPSRPLSGDRRTLFFYARPNNYRNLYWRGLEALTAAIEEGVLDPEAWRFIFVGRDIGRVALPGRVVPEVLENLAWDRYAEVVRSVDLGLALMDTPHVSYPPLDLAASGAVVVTNTCGLKQSLDQYSRNIIIVPPTVDAIARGLAAGVELVADDETRRRNTVESGIQRDWRATLETTIEACAGWISG
ncbi:MAG: methyltransferase domain-containing protein [Candidatus Dormibacteraeota bacterium]|nr:methyltransferase domain-containing protein [Candidatus Dormibacteraeota bacterium]